MSEATQAATDDVQVPVGPEAIIEELRERLARGERLSEGAWSEFYRAVHTLDPMATEETIEPLVGSGSTHVYRGLIAWAPLIAGERVLDLGCGSGGASRAAAQIVGQNGEVVAVDSCAEALRVARQIGDVDGGAPITYRRARGEDLSRYGDRSFDCVIASLMLDEVGDLATVLREIVRVLRPGGRFVASVTAFDALRPQDAAFMGAVMSVVARHAPGALIGRASRASIPQEPNDAAAFRDSGLLVPEERDLQFSTVLETVDDAWAFFSRTKIAHILGADGREALRETLTRRVPHSLALPIRFMRTRRPG